MGIIARSGSPKYFGNVEPFLNYNKLHRTGRLLRGLKVKRVGSFSGSGFRVSITLYNNVPYASDHQTGGASSSGDSAVIKSPYARTGTVVITGARQYARPFMTPSRQVLRAPQRLLDRKMRSYGW